MKRILLLSLICLLSLSAFASAAPVRGGEKTRPQGPYFGQTPPDTTPKIFAPGVISSTGAIVIALTFSPDGRELCYSLYGGPMARLMLSRLEKDGWTEPREASFSKGFHAQEPHIGPDGQRLYFGWEKPQPVTNSSNCAIWVVEKTAGGDWGEARYHGPGMSVSVARNGNLYMTDIGRLAGGGIIVFPSTGGRYGSPRQLIEGDHSCIAPDEGYILFDSERRGGQGGADLWVSFRRPDGSWSGGLNLGNGVNTPADNWIPSISPDGKYIFYTTGEDVYWVSAKILDPLKAKALGSANPDK